MKTRIHLLLGCLMITVTITAQNVGIGANSPSEKLEVAGVIYSNDGGIKFPDQTIQRTAAYNSTPASVAIPRGIGFIEFSLASLEGPLDTLGKTDVSLIYATEWDLTTGSNQAVLHPPFLAVKQMDKASPNLFKHMQNQANTTTAWIYLTRENASGDLEIYFEIKLTKVILSEFSPSLYPGGSGGFAHTETLKMVYETISIKDLASNNCYCWNVVLNAACTCN